jgi:hypothetical protein
MDWKTVAEKIIQDDQNKWDRKVAGQDLRISGDGALELVTEVARITRIHSRISPQPKCARDSTSL